MKTKLLYAKDITATEQINEAADILKNGGLVAVPTETVYGLAASALNEKAVANIFKAKGRPNDNPLIVHIADFSELDNIVAEVSDLAKECMDAFWPGPFTAVLPKKDIIPNIGLCCFKPFLTFTVSGCCCNDSHKRRFVITCAIHLFCKL